ncbi:hypothetical protein, partial [Sinomonas cellulolyticus]
PILTGLRAPSIPRGPRSKSKTLLDSAAQETSERHLEPLLGGGLVAEKAGVFRITDLGREELKGARETVQGIRDISVRGLEDGDYERVLRTLEAMIVNLSA